MLWLACASPKLAPPGEQALDSPPAEDSDADSAAGQAPHPGIALEGLPLLRRLSLDLRGALPSEEEVAEVVADPEAVERLSAEMLLDPRHEEALVELYNLHWQTRVDNFGVNPEDYGYGDRRFDYVRSIGEEPLRLLARVAVSDVPWTEIVSTDQSMANEMLAEMWPVDYPAGAEGWQSAAYTDGRPALGVLSTNGLWWRYESTPANLNRSRAAALSRLLLCEDYLTRQISPTPSALLESGGLEEALRVDPGCTTCHSSLDPLASALFGFWAFDLHSAAELTWYHPERERLGLSYLGVEPAWFGEPLGSVQDLAAHVAADERFQACAVATTARLYWQRPIDPFEDFGALQEAEAAFVAGGLRMSALEAALLAGPEYRAGDVAEEAQVSTGRLLRPEQLAAVLEELTGFVWTEEGYAQLYNDEQGYRVLGGGVDGVEVQSAATSPSLTQVLVLQRAAQGAAQQAVQAAQAGESGLLSAADLELRPGEEAFRDRLVGLHRRLLGEEPDEEMLLAEEALWLAVEAESGSATAWTSLLAALLRDPAFWVY